MTEQTSGPLGEEGPPARSRGVIALLEENCTVCMACARECPVWCIDIESHQEAAPTAQTQPGRPPGRSRSRNVLDRFEIDYSVCMYCSICIEVCPFDALFWSPEHEYSATSRAGLSHGREELRRWMWTVPVPTASDERAEETKEVAAARRAAERSR